MDAVAPAISPKPDELDVADTCHCMVPVLPLKVKVLAVPLQVLPAPLIVPATDVGFTVTIPLALFADGQTPLVTTAR